MGKLSETAGGAQRHTDYASVNELGNNCILSDFNILTYIASVERAEHNLGLENLERIAGLPKGLA